MKLRILFFIAVLIFANTIFAQATQIDVPNGVVPVIDGQIEEAEWAKALKLPLHGGDSVYFQQANDTLYIAIKGAAGGFSSLAIGDMKKFRILHASTGLITAAYQKEGGNWKLAHDFKGPLIEEGKQFPRNEIRLTQEYRKAQMNQFGWYANLIEMGPLSETEFQIPISSLPEKNVYLSIAFFQIKAKEKIARFPEDLDGGAINRELLSGSAKNGLDFNPEKWVELLDLK